MELYQRFDLLIRHIQRQTEIPKSVRANIESDLNWFRTQSLCDLDRRERTDILRARWTALVKALRGSTALRGLKQDASFWIPIGVAFGIPYVEPPVRKAKAVVQQAEKPTTPDADKLLGAMAERAQRLPVISESERLAVYMGLRFLESEAKKNRPQRNNQEIQRVWSQLHKIMEHAGLLDKFKSDISIRHRLEFFINDGF